MDAILLSESEGGKEKKCSGGSIPLGFISSTLMVQSETNNLPSVFRVPHSAFRARHMRKDLEKFPSRQHTTTFGEWKEILAFTAERIYHHPQL